MRRKRDMFLPLIVLDRGSASPLHRQVSRQIAGAIRSGECVEMRLPSTRVLARLLGVSRNTVLTAYDELVAEGLIRGRRGAAMFVSAGEWRDARAFDLRRIFREAQYPSRTLWLADPEGTPLYVTY